MRSSKYYVNYFKTDLTLVGSSDDHGPKVKMEHTIPATEEEYIILVMARRKGHSWSDVTKSMIQDSNSSVTELLNKLSEIDTLDSQLDLTDKPDIEIYPNPSDSKLFIEVELFRGGIDAAIYSIDGKKMEELFLNEEVFELELTKYEKGIYIIYFSLEGEFLEQNKFIKL